MIGKLMRRKDFVDLHWYLTEQEDAKVLNIRNLFSETALDAAKVMENTAAMNQRVRKPVIHLALRAAPKDRLLSDSEWENVAASVMGNLGLSNAQAMIVRHGNDADQHIHLMVNRIDGETFKAAPLRNDRRKIQATLRKLEKELGIEELARSENPAPRRSEGEVWEKRRRGTSSTDTHREAVKIAWRTACAANPSEGFAVFCKALHERGFLLARGDRRGVVILGPNGKLMSLSRAVPATTERRRKVFADLDRGNLPTLEAARSALTATEKPQTRSSGTRVPQRPIKSTRNADFANTALGSLRLGLLAAELVGNNLDDENPSRGVQR